PQLRRLDKKVFAVAVDLVGHGESSGEACDSIENYVSLLLDFLDALEIENAIICGHSMGGAIAQKCALTYPDKTSGIILVATGAKLRVFPIIFEMLKNDVEKFFEMFQKWGFGPNAKKSLIDAAVTMMRSCPPEFIARDFLACDRFNLMNEVQNIEAPTLVVGAKFDNLTPVKYSEYLAQNIKNAKLEIIEDSGHMIPLEQPLALSRLILDFAKSV
ncbi:MAG: alpha/beta hydrolase, partial [Candidatus Aenigmatarchaeota archaeon]